MPSSCTMVGLSPILALSTTLVAFASAASMAAVPSFTDCSAKTLALASRTFWSSSLRCWRTAALAVEDRFLRVSILDCSAENFVRICRSLDLTSARGPCLTLATSTVFLSAASAASTQRACTALMWASMLSSLPAKGGEGLKYTAPSLSERVTHTLLPSRTRAHIALLLPSLSSFSSSTSMPSPASTTPTSLPPSSASVATTPSLHTYRSRSSIWKSTTLSFPPLPPTCAKTATFCSSVK
mmetsp:Transcript_28490/g.81963  ORF Transcript_28490/g.81963 Transcript_28490/m.81963 type:complete len:240 (+) Transcript_28490:1966-2685(+)